MLQTLIIGTKPPATQQCIYYISLIWRVQLQAQVSLQRQCPTRNGKAHALIYVLDSQRVDIMYLYTQ